MIQILAKVIDHRQWTPEEQKEYREAQVRWKREAGKKRYVKAYLNRARRLARAKGLEVL